MATPGEVTQLLNDWSNGDLSAMDKLMPIIYRELRRLADNRLRQERADHTLQATALVNELFLRLTDWKSIEWKSKAHFLGVAAKLMRNILVDYARTHMAAKRGGSLYKLSFSEAINLPNEQDMDLIALDDALLSLASIDPQQSKIVELRFFGGLTFEEVAEVLQVSPATVSREWNLAKIWLLREISKR
jgi:RNA polymerase sigma factor (TIGR02999 family)